MLNARLEEVHRGEYQPAPRHPVTCQELYEALHKHKQDNAKPESVAELERRWRLHLAPYFGHVAAQNLAAPMMREYRHLRRAAGAAVATVNRELQALRKMLNFAKQNGQLRTVPYVPIEKENNTRQGFVEDADYTRLAAEATEPWLRLFLELGYTYPTRKSELLKLKVGSVNLLTKTIWLAPGKTGEGRELAMTQTVAKLLTLAVEGKGPEDRVLTRADGKPVKNFYRAWASLTAAAGLSGKIPHDLRRSAAKALRLAGVPESVVMKMGGWQTAAMFRRYAIVSRADQLAAVAALEKARAEHGYDSALIGPPEPPALSTKVQ